MTTRQQLSTFNTNTLLQVLNDHTTVINNQLSALIRTQKNKIRRLQLSNEYLEGTYQALQQDYYTVCNILHSLYEDQPAIRRNYQLEVDFEDLILDDESDDEMENGFFANTLIVDLQVNRHRVNRNVRRRLNFDE